MELRLLEAGYKTRDDFYQAFLDGTVVQFLEEDGEKIWVAGAPDFPIYLGKKRDEEKREDFLKIVRCLEKYFLNMNREYSLSERFWHSYLCTEKREYLLQAYPEIQQSEKAFRNIVLKKFDWENYLYKGMLAAQYVHDMVEDPTDYEDYYQLILDNLDIFNYIIKYEIFRNANFLIHFLEIIRDGNVNGVSLSKIMKAKIKGRADLGKDERYGRRVIYEFNKAYPMILAPMLSKEQLKEYTLRFLDLYYDPQEAHLEKEVEETWSEGE